MKNKLTALLFLVCANISFAHNDVTFKFAENKGQLDSKVLYHNKLHLGDMFLERDRFTFNMYDPKQLDDLYNKRHGADKLSGTELNPADPKVNQRGDYSPSGEDNLAEATAAGSPTWFTINLKSTIRVNEKVQIQGAITNMLDRHYKQFSSGISAPGRSFSITLRLQL